MGPTPKRRRLDELLLERGLFDDARVAHGWILAGKVLVEGAVVTKPGFAVRVDAEVALRGAVPRYVSRGGIKLEAAIRRFGVAVEGKTVLDAGASAGGFSDCLLHHGASRVYAVDVGYGQLRGKVASDERVVSMERTNISDLTLASFDPPIALCVFDLSYLSAASAAAILAALFRQEPHLVGLIKPLYEGVQPPDRANPDSLHEALLRVHDALNAKGLATRQLMVSPILGGNGAVEFLAEIVAAGRASAASASLCSDAIAELRAHPPADDP
jgi:23S rRNA (cytidine1920-2'-O)/16S rRNA (cytidine1409-2'-O)-methyltransferase